MHRQAERPAFCSSSQNININQEFHLSYIMIHYLVSDNLHDVLMFPLGLSIRLAGPPDFKSIAQYRVRASDALFASRQRCLEERRPQGRGR